jgi:7-keto-8-aminopelargonate synthetase-like enzyme
MIQPKQKEKKPIDRPQRSGGEWLEQPRGRGLTDLTRRLTEDGVVQFYMEMRDRFPGAQMKDMVAQAMDRERRIRFGNRTVINFGSDSFLGFDQDSRIQAAIAAGAKKWGTHNGASRAFCSVQANSDAEARLARWLGVEDTLIFPSVTLANVGLIPPLAGAHDLLVVDRLAHNSIHEGAKIAKAEGATVKKLSPCSGEKLSAMLAKENRRACVVAVDGVYSMSGRTPPLASLDRIVRSNGGVLYIDDAHGTGVFGPHGRGMAARELGRLDDVLMVGSLSKALSCMGAFVTCTSELKTLLKMKSNSYIFGGPVPPPYLEAVCVACDILCSPEYDVIMQRLKRRIRRLFDGLDRLRFHVLRPPGLPGTEGPIVAILVRDEENTLRAGKWLFDHGFYVQSVLFPAVGFNQGVLRIQVNANHSLEAIDGLLNALADLKQEIPFPQAAESRTPRRAEDRLPEAIAKLRRSLSLGSRLAPIAPIAGPLGQPMADAVYLALGRLADAIQAEVEKAEHTMKTVGDVNPDLENAPTAERQVTASRDKLIRLGEEVHQFRAEIRRHGSTIVDAAQVQSQGLALADAIEKVRRTDDHFLLDAFNSNLGSGE